MLTIAYFTSRKEPKIEWFFNSLLNEAEASGLDDLTGFKIVVVDFWAQLGPDWPEVAKLGFPSVDRRLDQFNQKGAKWLKSAGAAYMHVRPKPTVWQGPHRLTKADYFAAANARNTAICLAPDGYIAFVDDLSVLMPGWLAAVREAQLRGYIVAGAYRKVKDMVVEQGKLVSFTDHPSGVDHRFGSGVPQAPVPCPPSWLFGCSLAAPVEAFLKINGYPEACDSMGYEDSITGSALAKNGYEILYDRRMMTYESEELHHQLPVMLREDPCRGDPHANPRDDMSHAMLRNFANATRFENYFGEEGIRGLRKRVLAGEPFPVMGIPQHRWFDSKPLSELPS